MNRKAILALALFSILAAPPSIARADNWDYLPLYAEILNEYSRETNAVVQVRVNYAELRGDPRWKTLISKVETTVPSDLGTRDERLAYWINIYNIFAIDLVLGAYPIESIREVGSILFPVWKADAGKIDGRVYSLDQIENRILRPVGEPRIHGAIVCASISCPPLRRTPFEESNLDEQLDASIRLWLSNPEKGARLDRARATLHLSKIFSWFRGDFLVRGGVIDFVLPYLPEDDAVWIRANRTGLQVEHLEYDWQLNR
jgi:hypothetical protein